MASIHDLYGPAGPTKRALRGGDDFAPIPGLPTREAYLRGEWVRREERRRAGGQPLAMVLQQIQVRDAKGAAIVYLQGLLPSGRKLYVTSGYQPFFDVVGREGEDAADVWRRFAERARPLDARRALSKVAHRTNFEAPPLMGGLFQERPNGAVRLFFRTLGDMGDALKLGQAVEAAVREEEDATIYRRDPASVLDARGRAAADADDAARPAAARATAGLSAEAAALELVQPRLPSLWIGTGAGRNSQQRILQYLYGWRVGEWLTVHSYEAEPASCRDCKRHFKAWQHCKACGGAAEGERCEKCDKARFFWAGVACACDGPARAAKYAWRDFDAHRGAWHVTTRLLSRRPRPYEGARAARNYGLPEVRAFAPADWPRLDGDARDGTPKFDLVYDIETYAPQDVMDATGKPPQGSDPRARLISCSMLLYRRGARAPLLAVALSDSLVRPHPKFVAGLAADAEGGDADAAATLERVRAAFPRGWVTVVARRGRDESMLRAFAQVFRAMDPDTILDFNGHGYDMPFIKEKAAALFDPEELGAFFSAQNAFEVPRIRAERKWDWQRVWGTFEAKVGANSDVQNHRLLFDGCVAVDAMMQLKRDYPEGVADPERPGSMCNRLDAYLREFKLSPKVELPGGFRAMWRGWERRDKPVLTHALWYCMWDSAGTYGLFRETGILDRREAFALEGLCSLEAAFHQGDGMRVEGGIFAEAMRRGLLFSYDSVSSRAPKIRGAWVKPPRPGWAVGSRYWPSAAAEDDAADLASDDSDDDSASDDDADGAGPLGGALRGALRAGAATNAATVAARRQARQRDLALAPDGADGYPLADYDFASQYPNAMATRNLSYETVTEDENLARTAARRLGCGLRVIDCQFKDDARPMVPVWSLYHDDNLEQLGVLPKVVLRWLDRRAQIKSVDLKGIKKARGAQKVGDAAAVRKALTPVADRWDVVPADLSDADLLSVAFADKLARKQTACTRAEKALKVLANTSYGKTAQREHSRLPALLIGGGITATARESIRICAEMAHEDMTTPGEYYPQLLAYYAAEAARDRRSVEDMLAPLRAFAAENPEVGAWLARAARGGAWAEPENTHDYTDTDSVYIGTRRAGVSAIVRALVGLEGAALARGLTALRDYAYPYAEGLGDQMNERLAVHYGNRYMRVKLEGLHMRRLFIRAKCYFSLKIGPPAEMPSPEWEIPADVTYAKFKDIVNICGHAMRKRNTSPLVVRYCIWFVREVFALRAFGTAPDFRALARRVVRDFTGAEPLYEGAPRVGHLDFVERAKYGRKRNPDAGAPGAHPFRATNPTVECYVAGLRAEAAAAVARGAAPPPWAAEPTVGERFRFLVCGQERLVQLVGSARGGVRVRKLKVGERMIGLEHYEASQRDDPPGARLTLDWVYYAERHIAAAVAEMISHLPAYDGATAPLPEHPDDEAIAEFTRKRVNAAKKDVRADALAALGVTETNHHAAARALKAVAAARSRAIGPALAAALAVPSSDRADAICAAVERRAEEGKRAAAAQYSATKVGRVVRGAGVSAVRAARALGVAEWRKARQAGTAARMRGSRRRAPRTRRWTRRARTCSRRCAPSSPPRGRARAPTSSTRRRRRSSPAGSAGTLATCAPRSRRSTRRRPSTRPRSARSRRSG
jgi:hypothetical protein